MVIKRLNNILVGLYHDHISIYNHVEISPNLTYHYRYMVIDGDLSITESVIDCNQKLYRF